MYKNKDLEENTHSYFWIVSSTKNEVQGAVSVKDLTSFSNIIALVPVETRV